MAVIFRYRLLQSSEGVHTTSKFHLPAGPERPKTKQVTLGLVLLLCAALSLALAACESAGGIGDTSTGWLPVAAIAVPEDTGSRINEGRNIDPLDNAITVTDVTVFDVGQVILIDKERLRITSIREQDLVVTRGADDTRPQTHADQATIYSIGERFVVFASTKQGETLALKDDGFESPIVEWNCRQREC